MSAKGLDERGFLWVFLGKAFFFSDGWTGVKMVLTGCQRVYRVEKNKCHKAWHLQIEWDLFMQACHKSKTFFFIEIKKKMLLWIVRQTFSGVISRTVFRCPTVLLQLDWVSTKTWKDLVCTRVFECFLLIFNTWCSFFFFFILCGCSAAEIMVYHHSASNAWAGC